MLHRTLKIMERDLSKNFCSHLFFKFFTLVQNTQILQYTLLLVSSVYQRKEREREEEKDGENDEQQESSDKISQSLFLTSCAVVSRL